MKTDEREQLHIVKILRILALLGMNTGVTHPVKNNDGEASSCLMVVKFETLFYNSYYTHKEV